MISLGETPPSNISCDIFATVLRRNAVCEANRMLLMARRAADMLARERDIASILAAEPRPMSRVFPFSMKQ